MADIRLGRQNILIVEARITMIDTVILYQNSKGVFFKSRHKPKRIFVTPVNPKAVNGYSYQYEYRT